MQSQSNGKVLTCFYQNTNIKEIIAISLNIVIDTTNITNSKIETISSLSKSQSNNGAKIIKSTLSQDKTKSLVCYINDYNNTDCLIYDITNNQWSGYYTYLIGCLLKFSSLNIEYFDNLNEYILYCFQSSSKINLIKFNSNFEKQEDEQNGIYDLSESLSKCTDYSLSSLIHNNDNEKVNIFVNCDGNILKYKVENPLPQTTIITIIPITTIPTKTTLIKIFTSIPKIFTTLMTTIISTIPKINKVSTTMPITTKSKVLVSSTIKSTSLAKETVITSSLYSSISLINKSSITSTQTNKFLSTIKEINNNELVIIQNKNNKTKEEIINNLDKVMQDYDIDKIYEIFGDDYNIKISPINMKVHKNISTYIDFSNCENILREKNGLDSSSILTVYQIEITNPHEQSLINDVEYAVFNENKERLDLSVCKDEFIIINYQINNSMINISKINYYSNLGINIFNIEDEFFNDICYSHSEGESDVILKDRISDIYENISVCESNCKYNNINITENIVSCNCSVKTQADSVVQPPRLDKIIRSSFEDSNLAVMKCYNLVFGFKNKLNNIGFLTFSVLIFLHFPFFIYYSIFNITLIKRFIFIEMGKFHYTKKIINPTKKDNNYKRTQKKKKQFIKENKVDISSRDKIKENNSSTTRIINKKNKLLEGISSKKKSTVFNNSKNIYELLNLNKRRTLKDKSKKAVRHKSMQPVLMVDCKILNNNYINMNNHGKWKKNNTSNIQKNNKKLLLSKSYSLIQIDANNSTNNKPENSDLILDNFDYEIAIKYDKRNFWRIFYICILAKESIINIIFFKTPLDLFSLRMCLFIFSYSCDLAFNTIF